ncbi:MAG: carbohydrate ABC transporter permease [Lachnospiraceae bacterium]|nr:carbohydrate ABC transporter permease [Lachnospiraceae bacterium]
MQLVQNYKTKIQEMKDDKQFANDRRKAARISKKVILGLFKAVVLVGISYMILSPLLGMLSKSFFTDNDVYNPMVYLFPIEGTLERYSTSLKVMSYGKVLFNTIVYDVTLMAVQLLICSLVGYGFARFDFPLKKVLFACVVVMIVLPMNTIMVPLYMTFRNFGPFGNLLSTPVPMYIMTIFGCGLRSGLYIYIFNQFFRGLPKEIEEAAFVDGAGMFYTYSRIMLVNAMPSVITVSIFSLVWQYNDSFYSRMFTISADILLSKKIGSLSDTIANSYQINDPTVLQLYTYAGVILMIIPVLLIYILLQRKFIEGVERSGIVG